MLYSRLLGQSSKTEGTPLKIKSHRLLVQAGYIRESTAGRYYFLPLGQKVQLKLMDIIRRAMNEAGAQEMVAPVLHPLRLWQETNRTAAVGFELMQIKDRRGSGFALGGTAEEMMVDLVRNFNLSYKDLPFNIYQFGLKFRDELRARGGLLRVREFVMKDAYSFSTEAQFAAIYEQMATTYSQIFKSLGLSILKIEADGGYIGGQYCHEFVVPSEVGESPYLMTDKGYLAHEDVAVFDKKIDQPASAPRPLQKVACERGSTMADSLAAHQPRPLTQHLKNVVYHDEKDRIIVACLRGDLEVNEVKLQKILGCHQLVSLKTEQVAQLLNSQAGFISPVDLKARDKTHELVIVADDSLEGITNLISGANEANFDYININLDRDFKPHIMGDIALAKDDYKALDGQKLKAAQGIEVGNIFQLGYHYSAQMKGAEYVNQAGKREKYYMGCYGIGIGRTMAAVAETMSDEAGLIWPKILAPYEIYLATLHPDEQSQTLAAELYEALKKEGLEVLYDDRQVSSGEKLANADLLGLPLRIILSPQTLAQKAAELKKRVDSEITLISLKEVPQKAAELLQNCP